MTRSRILAFLFLGAVTVSAVIFAQQNLPPLPAPTDAKPNFGSVVPRPDAALPKVPAGFTVELYADDVPNARMMVFAPNDDLFVSQPSQNAVMILRATNKNGLPDQRFTYAQGAAPARGRGGPGGPGRGAPPAASNGEMTQPFGLAFHEGYLYVGNTNSLVRYKYATGDTKASGAAEKLTDLPGGGNHFTRNIAFSRDGKKMYVSVGSTNNIDETGNGNERRAMIHEYNADGTN